jgi:aminopeptidase
MDSRYNTLADNLVRHSVFLKKGEHVLIDAFDVPDDMVVALVRAVRVRKGVPHVALHHARISRELLLGVTEEQVRFQSKHELRRMKGIDAYIALRGAHRTRMCPASACSWR